MSPEQEFVFDEIWLKYRGHNNEHYDEIKKIIGEMVKSRNIFVSGDVRSQHRLKIMMERDFLK